MSQSDESHPLHNDVGCSLTVSGKHGLVTTQFKCIKTFSASKDSDSEVSHIPEAFVSNSYVRENRINQIIEGNFAHVTEIIGCFNFFHSRPYCVESSCFTHLKAFSVSFIF